MAIATEPVGTTAQQLGDLRVKRAFEFPEIKQNTKAAVTRDGEKYLTIGNDNILRVYSMATTLLLHEIKVPRTVGLINYKIITSHDSKYAITTNDTNRIYVSDIVNGIFSREIKTKKTGVLKSENHILEVALSPDDKILFAVADNTRSIFSWDFVTGNPLKETNLTILNRGGKVVTYSEAGIMMNPYDCDGLSCTADGKFLKVYSSACGFQIYDVGTLQKTVEHSYWNIPKGWAFSNDDKLFAGIFLSEESKTPHITIFDCNPLEKLQKLSDHMVTQFALEEKITEMRFSLDNRLLVVNCESIIRIFSVENWTELLALETGVKKGSLLNLPPRLLLSGPGAENIGLTSSKSRVKFWNLEFTQPTEEATEPTPESTQNIAFIIETFQSILLDPGKLTLISLHEMFSKVENVITFKLVYSLANILKQLNPAFHGELQAVVHSGLETLAFKGFVMKSGESGQDAKTGAKHISAFKLLLDSAEEEGFIDKGEKYYLDNLAEDNKTFSDTRFVTLEKQVAQMQQQLKNLSEQVQQNQEDIVEVAKGLDNLKKALKKKSQRDAYMGVIKFALTFVGGNIMDVFTGIADFSSLNELGSGVLKVSGLKSSAKEFGALLENGSSALQKSITPEAAEALRSTGIPPEEFSQIFVEAHTLLKNEAMKRAAAAVEEKVEKSLKIKDDESDDEDSNLLHEAISNGASAQDIEEYWSNYAPYLNTKDDEGRRPVQRAAQNGLVDIVDMLLKKGSKGNPALLMSEAKQNRDKEETTAPKKSNES